LPDVQLQALSRAIAGGAFTEFVESRITVEFFSDDEYRKVWQWALDHWKTYGSAPTEKEANRAFPTVSWDDGQQPTQYYLDELRERRKVVLYEEASKEIQNFIFQVGKTDSAGFEALIKDVLDRARFETGNASITDIVRYWPSYKDVLKDRMANPGYLRGVSTGFDGIDFVTGGFQPEQLITFTGTPKTGKSSFLLYSALAVWNSGQRPMFVTFEMSTQEQFDRLLSLLSGVSLTKIMTGQMSRVEMRKIEKTMSARQAMGDFFFAHDVTSTTSPAGIQVQIQDIKPDIVFIDGAYMMDSDNPRLERGSAQALTDITRSLKRLAQRNKIPICITTQSLLSRSRGGLTLASLGYSSSFAQDSDVVLGVELDTDDQGKVTGRSKLRVLASRSGPRKDVLIEWDWNRGYVAEVAQVAMGAGYYDSWDQDDGDDQP
jgi:replicative DNA helicase